jgi:2-keto-3-deoxy-L-rhamnonate aldolase RhmA
MGRLGKLDDPEVVAAIRDIIRIARAAGLYVGMGMGPDPDGAQKAFEMGVHWIQCGGDFSYMAQYADGLYSQIRARSKAPA